jgi:diaminopimelate epimerase
MPSIPFTKASACGNDFLLIDRKHRPPDAARLTRLICGRHNGIGADGVEWISALDPAADITAELINADGSPAEISGNGTRCVAAHWCAAQGIASGEVKVGTGAGVKVCRLLAASTNEYQFEMNLGPPKVLDPLSLALDGKPVNGLRIWTGNPQFVVFVEDFDFDWRSLGAAIQAQPVFTEGTNVDFVRVVSTEEIEVRFFERGAGETQSSGTGSCASAVAAIHAKDLKSPLRVKAPGGIQTVRWEGEIFLQGPARIIGTGEFFI